jgi:hypothetical protein
MAAYAKQANDPELLVYVQKIRLQAQRRAGEILIAMKETGELDHKKNLRRGPVVAPIYGKTLASLGVSPDQSMRWHAASVSPASRRRQTTPTPRIAFYRSTVRSSLIAPAATAFPVIGAYSPSLV